MPTVMSKPAAAKVEDRPEVTVPQEAIERPRVLVVDDDERNLLAIQNVLEDIGELVVAKSGEEALRHLLKGEFAVILLDVYMPGMDGYEVAQIVREREQTKGIPIVFLSAVNKEAEHMLRGYSMGAVDYVFKPVDAVVLRSKVAVFVDLLQRPRRSSERRGRNRPSSTPTCAPMPSGCASSRNFAGPSSGRRRSSSRCRSSSIWNLSTARTAARTSSAAIWRA